MDFRGASRDGSVSFFFTINQLSPYDTDSNYDTYRREGDDVRPVTAGPGWEIAPNTESHFGGVSADGSVAAA